MKALYIMVFLLVGLAVASIALKPGSREAPVEETSSRMSPGMGPRERHRVARQGTIDRLDFQNVPEGAERENLLRKISAEWANEDPASAENWAGGLALESERKAALSHIALAWGKKSPAKAIELARRHDLPQATVDAITGRWGQDDHDAAMEWAQKLSSEPVKQGALAEIITAYAETDPARAAQLVETRLQPGSAQDEAIMTVLHHWLRADETAAVEWVGRFQGEEFRNRADAEIEGFVRERVR